MINSTAIVSSKSHISTNVQIGPYCIIGDNVYIDEEHDIRMVIDIEQHENIIGNLRVEYNKSNLVEQGFVFKRTSMGTVCGCGESFTPINSPKRKLGWD